MSFCYYMVPTCRAQQFDSMHCPHLGIMPITSESSESDTSIQINALALKYLKQGDQGKILVLYVYRSRSLFWNCSLNRGVLPISRSTTLIHEKIYPIYFILGSNMKELPIICTT